MRHFLLAGRGQIFYRGAKAVIVVYAIDERASFENVAHWCGCGGDRLRCFPLLMVLSDGDATILLPAVDTPPHSPTYALAQAGRN